MEKLNIFLDFIATNSKSFNQDDFLDCFHVVSYKIENDIIFFNLNKNRGLKILNEYILSNYNELNKNNSSILLAYLGALSIKEIRVLNSVKLQDFISGYLSNNLNNHQTLN